jgi:hypothetical protein
MLATESKTALQARPIGRSQGAEKPCGNRSDTTEGDEDREAMISASARPLRWPLGEDPRLSQGRPTVPVGEKKEGSPGTVEYRDSFST